jgi:aspartate/glutamate racemase
MEGIKAGHSNQETETGRQNAMLLATARDLLKKSGVESEISGCTEIPLVLDGPDNVNPTQVLADENVRRTLIDRV